MKHGSHDMPIACYLTSAELRDRAATLLAQFTSAVIGTEELRDRYAFRVPGDGKWIAMIAKMIVAERECCPFLTFEFVAQPNMGPVIVMGILGPWGPAAIGLRKSKRHRCLPLTEVHLLRGLPGFFHGGLEFALKLQLTNLVAHKRDQGKVARVCVPAFVAKDVPS